MNLRAIGLVSVLACVAGCGSSDEEGTGTTSDDTEATEDTTDSTDTSGSETSTDDATDTTGDETDQTSDTDTSGEPVGVSPDPTGLPEPILPDVPPNTPLSELDEDELEEVCGAYIQTAEVMTARLPGLCGILGVGGGLDAQSNDEETVRAACEVEYSDCQSQAISAQATVDTLSCGPASECDATVKQFNDCNRQISNANRLLLDPLLELDAPECAELTLAEATALEGEVNGILIVGAISAIPEGGLPSEAEGACGELESQCPDFAAPYASLSAIFGL